MARGIVTAAGGEVLDERYLPIGAHDVNRMIAEIRATRADFVLNSLVGASSYAFLKAYHALGTEDSHFRAASCPGLSCNLTECELSTLDEASKV